MRVATAKRLLLLSVATYIANTYYAFVTRYELGLYTLAAGTVLLALQTGWRDSLTFALCYGTFLALLSVTTVIGWVVACVRPALRVYNGIIWFVWGSGLVSGTGSESLLSGAVPPHG